MLNAGYPSRTDATRHAEIQAKAHCSREALGVYQRAFLTEGKQASSADARWIHALHFVATWTAFFLLQRWLKIESNMSDVSGSSCQDQGNEPFINVPSIWTQCGLWYRPETMF